MKTRIRKSDSMYSLLIREARPICEMCKRRLSSQVHHYFSRRSENTRFDDQNIIAVCFTCHRTFHEDSETGRNFIIDKLGQDEFDKLLLRKNMYKKRDDKMDIVWLKGKQNKEVENV